MLVSWVLFSKPDVTMALNGALAGLVGITANCDQVPLWAAIVIGLVAGLLVVIGIMALDKLRIDDPVGAFPVQWPLWCLGRSGDRYLWYGGRPLVCDATDGTAVISAWAFFTMLRGFRYSEGIGILRVSTEEETRGLDISEHGMHAYPQSQLTRSTSPQQPARGSHFGALMLKTSWVITFDGFPEGYPMTRSGHSA